MLEFEASGLRQNEFCRNQGLALSTLQRQLRKRRLDKGETKEGSRFVVVELASRKRNVNSRSTSALEVVLSGGRRIGGIDLTRTRRKNWYRKELGLSDKM